MPGFSARASSTCRTTWARKLAEAAAVVWTSKVPAPFREPLTTVSPLLFSCGTGSPVTSAMSSVE